jgi:hypothetical protein
MRHRNVFRQLLPVLLLAAVAGGGACMHRAHGPRLSHAVEVPAEAGKVSFLLPESYRDDIVNPERGFTVGMNLVSPGDAARVRASGHSLGLAFVRLDDYRTRPLDDYFLASIDRGFAQARAAGIKVVLRFSYNAAYQADASKAQILQHIAQLAPLLVQNADVIAVLQAGFIGAWGEWHHSTNGLDNDTDRADILNAILSALPPSRFVQVRRPMFKATVFGPSALVAAEAYGGTPRARVGHHNDCFLADKSDSGTYARPLDTWKRYVSDDGRFTPIGGETCEPSPRTACGPAIEEMSRNHWSFLNQQHDERVVASWKDQGCAHEIGSRLGYRFVARRVTHDEVVAPGGVLDLDVDIDNTGFAAPFNFRSAYVVLLGHGPRRVAGLRDPDVRKWAPGSTNRLHARLRLPADLEPGTYSIALWLPDEAASLRADPRYAIRLANDDSWDDSTGDNVVSRSIRVEAAAPGVVSARAVDPSAKVFSEIR